MAPFLAWGAADLARLAAGGRRLPSPPLSAAAIHMVLGTILAFWVLRNLVPPP